jgi:phospholipase/carboxylesterase
MAPMNLLPTIEIQTQDPTADATASIIVLHGLGADGNDFVPFAQELKLGPVGPVRFVFPHAPTRPVTLNGGHVMRAWYDLLGMDLVRREDETGLRESLQAVTALIDRERARGVPASRIVLAGFSQGCAMALMTGLRYPERLGGVAGLSGYVPLAAATAAERHAANHAVPVFLAHGTQDPVVPFQRGEAARDLLQSLGYAVEWHSYPMQHSVCAQEVADFNRWLLDVLSRTA